MQRGASVGSGWAYSESRLAVVHEKTWREKRQGAGKPKDTVAVKQEMEKAWTKE